MFKKNSIVLVLFMSFVTFFVVLEKYYPLTLPKFFTRESKDQKLNNIRDMASRGFPIAQFAYGDILYKEKQHFFAAADYYKMAADQGYAPAQFAAWFKK